MAREKVYKSEKDVKNEVKKTLDKHGWFWFMPPSNAFGKTGISDFVALRAGVVLAIETKFNGNKPTPMQKQFLDSVTAEGAFGFCIDEEKVDWFRRWAECFDRACEAASRKEKPSDEDGATMLNAIKVMTDLIS
jgi:hypothetical protein